MLFDYARFPTNSRQLRTSDGIRPSVYFLKPPWGIFFSSASTNNWAHRGLFSSGMPKSTAFLRRNEVNAQFRSKTLQCTHRLAT